MTENIHSDVAAYFGVLDEVDSEAKALEWQRVVFEVARKHRKPKEVLPVALEWQFDADVFDALGV